jgi:hypothetical protein
MHRSVVPASAALSSNYYAAGNLSIPGPYARYELLQTSKGSAASAHSRRLPCCACKQLLTLLFCCCRDMRCYSLGWSSAGSHGSPPACSAKAQTYDKQAITSRKLQFA